MYFTLRFGILKPFWIDAEQGGSDCRAWHFISFCLMFSHLYTHTESTSRLLLLGEPFALTIFRPSRAFLAASSSLNPYSLQNRLGIHIHTHYRIIWLYTSFFPITLVWVFSTVSLFQNSSLLFLVMESVVFWWWRFFSKGKELNTVNRFRSRFVWIGGILSSPF